MNPVGKRTRPSLAVLMLAVWQASLGLMLAAPSAHAHATVDAPVMASPSAESAAPCHGHEAATTNQVPEPSGMPPCCLADHCLGDCLLVPALPTAPVAVPVPLDRFDHPPEPLQARVPPRLVEFFRPPI